VAGTAGRQFFWTYFENRPNARATTTTTLDIRLVERMEHLPEVEVLPGT
jgi:hypothetical protein